MITQHKDTYVKVPLDANTGRGTGSFPVWMHYAGDTTPYYYRIAIVGYELPDGRILNALGDNYADTHGNYSAQIVPDPDCGKPHASSPAGAYYDNTVQKGNVEAVVSIHPYTVTYNDGVNEETVFADQENQYLIYGMATPAFVGTPVRTGYTFAGWSPVIAAAVTDNAVYTAQWTINQYTVTWVDGDGRELKQEQYNYGETPVYSGATPTKTQDVQYSYTFNGTKL